MPSPSPTPTPVSSPSKAKTPRKKKVDPELERRMTMANSLFAELNRTVFGDRITGVEIKWNPRFLTTAGRAKWKKSREGVHSSILELSPKVIDSDERLRNTVGHEMCHLASWMIDCDPAEQHGQLWNAWTKKVMRARPDIKITARHEYEISYKFRWKCTQCDNTYVPPVLS
ncbi:hypothetical protein EXIGLDRAFT_610323 [Exidia glandulosa HHB12029]|uniref:SprT-like domain-containing protein n=1 Tax=Exidia glandulosa HHB12029 TaxID=1314781 RepID=A0A165K0H4_EXIGL|nr:hypothetical protein EXIGLDRAFT_610323 [Exidia glandulosa HHB12029]